jgi:hypothetical protein
MLGLAYGWDYQYCDTAQADTCYEPFIEYDYRKRTVRRTWNVNEYDGPGEPSQLVVSSDGSMMFCKPSDPPPNMTLGRFILDSGKSATFDLAISGRGGLQLSPDNTELWHTDPGWPEPFPHSPTRGEIAIYDTRTLEVIHTISLRDYHPYPDSSKSTYAFGIEFLPNGEKAYVSANVCGAVYPDGAVLVVDAREKKIVKELIHYVERIIVAKKP